MDLVINGSLNTDVMLFNDDGSEKYSFPELKSYILNTVLYHYNALQQYGLRIIAKPENICIKLQAQKFVDIVEAVYKSNMDTLNFVVDETLVNFSIKQFPTSVESIVLTIDEQKLQAKDALDFACGQLRGSIVSEGTFVGEEYLLAHAEAVAWTEDGSVETDVPEAVSVWATASGISNAAAAADIIQTRTYFNQLLTAIRSIRLLGKADIDNAATDNGVVLAYNTAASKLKVLAANIAAAAAA